MTANPLEVILDGVCSGGGGGGAGLGSTGGAWESTLMVQTSQTLRGRKRVLGGRGVGEGIGV